MPSKEDILATLPSKEDIASAVGLESRGWTAGDMFTAFGIFGAGIALGAGLALLFAPKAGDEMRHDIAEKVGEVGGRLCTQMPQAAPSPYVPSVRTPGAQVPPVARC